MSVVIEVSPGRWAVIGDAWDSRELDFAEVIRHEWGEACWTAPILAAGEEADRYLRAQPRRGCF